METSSQFQLIPGSADSKLLRTGPRDFMFASVGSTAKRGRRSTPTEVSLDGVIPERLAPPTALFQKSRSATQGFFGSTRTWVRFRPDFNMPTSGCSLGRPREARTRLKRTCFFHSSDITCHKNLTGSQLVNSRNWRLNASQALSPAGTARRAEAFAALSGSFVGGLPCASKRRPARQPPSRYRDPC